jgi:para-aminobenzoate synthetase component 1
MNQTSFIKKTNIYGKEKQPFFFICDFDLENFYIEKSSNVPSDIKFSFENGERVQGSGFRVQEFEKEPVRFLDYEKALNEVVEEIKSGNTYLLNLTFETPIKTDLTLEEIYNVSNAKFKLYFKDQFVCFSPERFVKIEDNTISTYPMKGTIDANLPNAQETILNDKKEFAEHTMVVDLLRNDLSMVASNVKVENFRYIEYLKTNQKDLLQVSSHISGKLPKNWQENIGNIITTLLPAGSISGTPKKKTVQIINEIETHKRGFFTGIFGYFDGNSLDSAVMIRYIEKRNNQLFYKSGGGITLDSDVKKEYQEMIDKVYIG